MKDMTLQFEPVSYAKEVHLPRRADCGSAGYDFYLPHKVALQPDVTECIFTNVKACMSHGVVLLITIRSSLALRGVVLVNSPGVVDESYYNNPTNEGNIGLLLRNITQKTIVLYAGTRVAQGLFVPYLIHDVYQPPLVQARSGGFGSSGT